MRTNLEKVSSVWKDLCRLVTNIRPFYIGTWTTSALGILVASMGTKGWVCRHRTHWWELQNNNLREIPEELITHISLGKSRLPLKVFNIKRRAILRLKKEKAPCSFIVTRFWLSQDHKSLVNTAEQMGMVGSSKGNEQGLNIRSRLKVLRTVVE